MDSERKLTTTISGSFKFKPEIDTIIEEFTGLNVLVLAPEKGWLLLPTRIHLKFSDEVFKPLPSERDKPIKVVEDEFLSAIKKSDFLYVVCPDGYVGNSSMMEIGFAIALGIPVFASHPINVLEPDPMLQHFINQISILSSSETVQFCQPSDKPAPDKP
jgi:hypothetical protein